VAVTGHAKLHRHCRPWPVRRGGNADKQPPTASGQVQTFAGEAPIAGSDGGFLLFSASACPARRAWIQTLGWAEALNSKNVRPRRLRPEASFSSGLSLKETLACQNTNGPISVRCSAFIVMSHIRSTVRSIVLPACRSSINNNNF